MSHHQDGTFLGTGELPLYFQTWQHPNHTQAIFVMVHGLGAHSGLHPTIVNHLAPQGFAVYSFDLRGHGRSPGQRGYINHWSEYRQDLAHFLTFCQVQHPNTPCFLWGHSLGALIALDYAIRHPNPLKGIIASALPISNVNIATYKVFLAHLLSQLWPRFSLNSGIKLTALSQDLNYLATRQADPLRHRRGTARLTTEFFQTAAWVMTHATQLKIPLLMLHGEQDKIAAPQGSRTFYQKITWPDKTYIEYPDAYHDLHADIGFRQMLTDLEGWVQHHIHTPTPQRLKHTDPEGL